MEYTLLTTNGMIYKMGMESFDTREWTATLSSAAHTHLSIAGMVLSKAAVLAIYPTDQGEAPNVNVLLSTGMELALEVLNFDSGETAAAINAGHFVQLGEAILSGRYIVSAALA